MSVPLSVQKDSKNYPLPKPRKLSLKQERFVQTYLETGNATEAAVQVYSVKDRYVAGSIGTENLHKPAVQEEIQRRKGFSEETRAIVEAGLRDAIANARECLLHDDPDVQKAARKDLVEASKLFEERTNDKNKSTHNHLHIPSR